MHWEHKFAQRTACMRRSTVREILKHATKPGMISFAGGLPAPELFPIKETAAASERVLEKYGSKALQYGETEGVLELREYIAETFSRGGVRIRRENVLITTGGQQALDLIGRTLINEGDVVLVENPTYLALLLAWSRWVHSSFLSRRTKAAWLSMTCNRTWRRSRSCSTSFRIFKILRGPRYHSTVARH